MKQEADRSNTVLIGVFTVLAAGITLYQLSRPGYLFGLTSDISSWFGSSIRLVHGALPYRNFDLLQPPGFPLLASPFAFLSEAIGTRDALAVLRLCTPVLSAGSVLLIGKVVRHRGPIAVIVACGVMAFYPAEMYALRSGLLESVVDFFCLVGAALLFEGDAISPLRRRVILSGVAFGVALLVKAPGIVPIVVVAVLCASDVRRRLLPFLAGAVAGFGIPTLPFFVAAPGSFMRDTFTAALNSAPGTHRVSVPTRLGDITGTAAFNGGASIAVIATIVIVAVVAAAFLLRPQRPPSTLEWYAIAATVLAVSAQILPVYYYSNYTAFVAPFLALLLGLSLARLFERRLKRFGLVVVVVGVALLFTQQAIATHNLTTRDIARVVDAEIPAGACVLSDAPVELVTTNRFVASAPGCNNMIDPQGATLSYGFGSAGAEHLWLVMLEHANYIVTTTPFQHWFIPPDAQLREYVTVNFQLHIVSKLLFYVRHGFPYGSTPTLTRSAERSSRLRPQ
jgi:alpha-1,2-mannosyltransferase